MGCSDHDMTCMTLMCYLLPPSFTSWDHRRVTCPLQDLQVLSQQCMVQHGQLLLRTLLTATIDTCPRQLVRSLAAPLHSLLQDQQLGSDARGWLQQLLSLPDLPGELSLRLCKQLYPTSTLALTFECRHDRWPLDS